MTWIKGQSGNPSGKAKSIRTKSTEALRRVLARAITINLRTVVDDLKSLEPKDRLNVITRLLPYVLPTAEFDLNKMSEKDLDILIAKLREKEVTNSPKTPERIGASFVIN